MKKLLALSALTLLLAGCGDQAKEDDNDLMDMMNDQNTTEDGDSVTPSDEPYSVGPSEIPSDLVPNDEQ